MTDTSAPQAGAMEQWAISEEDGDGYVSGFALNAYMRDCDAAFAALEAERDEWKKRLDALGPFAKERLATLADSIADVERQRDALLASVRMFLSRSFIGDALGEREIAITDAQWLEAQGAYEAAIAAAQGGGAVSKAVGMVPGEHRGRHE